MIDNLHLLLNVIVYFLNFSGIICMMFVVTTNYNYFNMVGQIFDNWSLGFIHDLKSFDKTKSQIDEKCPDNYDFLFEFNFPGTKVGCNCLGVFNMTGYEDFENKLNPGSCSIMLGKLGCKNVADLPGKKINSISDKYFCVKRTNFNYFNNYTNSIYEKECPEGKQSCGRIDSLGNILCVDKCPFNNYFTNSTIQEANHDNLIELIKKSIENYIQFKTSQNNVCINNNEKNLYSEDIYELFNERKSMKCYTNLSSNNTRFKYDFRYHPLFYFKTEELFYQEDFIISNAKTLPKFPLEYFDYPTVIFGRNYIGWSKRCEDKLEPFADLFKLSHKLQVYSLYYLIFAMMMLIYCMLFIMIFKELIDGQYPLKACIVLIHMLMALSIFVVVIGDYWETLKAIDLCCYIIEKKCSDDETNKLLIFVLKIFTEISKLLIINIFLYLITICLSIVKVCLVVYKIFKRRIITRIINGVTNEFEMVLLL